MAISHHLNEELLQGYAAATLPEAVNLAIASHVSLCDDCRAALGSYDALGGAVLENGALQAVSSECKAQVLEMLSATAQAPSQTVRPAEKPMSKRHAVLPEPLRQYVGGDVDKVRWRPAGMGVRQAILKTSSEATARLLYIPAGVAVPDHGHRGLEMTLVLQGAYEDEEGRYARGDIEIADQSLEHMPIADISEDCICLAVTDAPLAFRGLLPRLAQPFLNI